MSIVSYLIEETARTDHAGNVVFAGFQHMSRFFPLIPRYREVAQHADHVYVFGVPDAPMPLIPNLTYVELQPEWQLTKEWFVVSHGPLLSTALATEEISAAAAPDGERQFRGVWVFNDPIVQIMYEWLAAQVEYRGTTDIEPDTADPAHIALMQQMQTRLQQMLHRYELDDTISDELAYFFDRATGAAVG